MKTPTKGGNIERGVNYGTRNSTTKGISQFVTFKNKSVASRLLGVSKFAGFMLQGLPAAEALLKEDVGKLNPIGFVVDDMIAEFEFLGMEVTDNLVNNASNTGANSLKSLFESNASVDENYMFEGASFETLQKMFNGEITDYGQFLENNSSSETYDVDILFKKDHDQNLQLKSIFIKDAGG